MRSCEFAVGDMHNAEPAERYRVIAFRPPLTGLVETEMKELLGSEDWSIVFDTLEITVRPRTKYYRGDCEKDIKNLLSGFSYEQVTYHGECRIQDDESVFSRIDAKSN